MHKAHRSGNRGTHGGILQRARQNWQLHLMLLLPLLWLIIFCYVPMYGVQIAFRKYRAVDGFLGSQWIGLENFQKFFSHYNFKQIIWNSLRISLYSLVAGFPLPILLALLINAVPSRKFAKTVQMATYAPYFISTVVMVGMIIQFLSPTQGLYGQLARAIGIASPTNLLAKPQYFDHIYVISGIWQGTGYGAIIYIAALAGIDPTLYEAATIDGANKMHKIIYIDIPSILPTATILLIMNMGSILNVGFEKIFLMQNSLNSSVTEVISTYIYKVGVAANVPNYSYSTAVGLFNSLISTVLVVAANTLARRMGGSSLW